MKGNLYLQGTIATAALLVVGLAPAPAGAADLAGAFTHASGIQFVANVNYERAILTVDGNGYTIKREFAAHQTPGVDLFDAEGYPLADGNYSYELQFRPGKADAERLKAAAAENGGRAPDAWQAISGSFAIRGGVIARPDVQEPQAARAIAESAFGAELAAAPSRASRAEAGDFDSDRAVERRGPSVTEAAAPAGEAYADGDGGSVVEMIVRLPESINLRRPISADGSNGRPEGSQPNQ